MSKIKIETLTSIHIGSGTFLQKGNDFVCGKFEDGEEMIAIVCLPKAMKLIGDKNINSWMAEIERGKSIDSIVRQYSPNSKIEDYAERIILLWSKPTDTLKEFIHDGMGRPYIPGSSIKGAIRTAVLSSIADEIKDKEKKVLDKKVSAKSIEADAFGNSPNTDIFRFLQVGDATFGNEYEAAIKMVNINERDHKSYWDESKAQLIEVLTSEDSTTFDMKLCTDLYEKAQCKVHKMPACMYDLPTLFSTINTHTLSLLKSEIDYWEERAEDHNAMNVDKYIKNIKKIKDYAIECASGKKSCILRIGHGSGWRFITGAWPEKLKIFDSDIVRKARPKNDKLYSQYEFPKTRRVDDECELLGFVRLTIL